MSLKTATSVSVKSSARPSARSTVRETTPEGLKSATSRSRSADPKTREPAKTDVDAAADLPSYARPTAASRGSILYQRTTKSMRSVTSRSASPGAKARDPFKSDADGTTVTPGWARSTAASRSRVMDDSDDEDMKPKNTSPRTASKKRPVSADPRYRSASAATALKSPTARSAKINTDANEEFSSPGQTASPSASTASRASPKHVDLSIYVGCEDPALFNNTDDEDWEARGGPRTNNYFHRPSSVARLGPNDAVAEFIAWVEKTPHGWEKVHEIFLKESSNPAGGEYIHRGHQPRAGLTKKRWVKLMMDNGYPNEAGLGSVFDEVAKEMNSDKDKKPSLAELRDKPLEAEITLPQLRRFERRLTSVNAVLQPTDKNSPANRFTAWIKTKYGSTLNAWRTMLDLHDTGRVSHSDFLTGCRNMGMGQYGPLVWNNLKKDKANPLELHELDPKEGENMEELAQVLWDKTGFDMNKAWVQMDVMNQNYLTLEQFKNGVRAFGFWGDAKLLFRGFDSDGLGRVKKEDFKYICKVSRIAHRRFDQCLHVKSAATELVSWCHREMGGADKLLTLLGFGGRGGHGKMECTVNELAHRLEALGFPHDADEAAARAAKEQGGSVVTVGSLHKLLTCHHKVHVEESVSQRFRSKPIVEHRFDWNSSVDDITAHNSQCCKYFRGYFGFEGAGQQPITKQPFVDQRYMPRVSQVRPADWESPITDHNPKWMRSESEPQLAAPRPAARPQTAMPRQLSKGKQRLVNKYGGSSRGRTPTTY